MLIGMLKGHAFTYFKFFVKVNRQTIKHTISKNISSFLAEPNLNISVRGRTIDRDSFISSSFNNFNGVGAVLSYRGYHANPNTNTAIRDSFYFARWISFT